MGRRTTVVLMLAATGAMVACAGEASSGPVPGSADAPASVEAPVAGPAADPPPPAHTPDGSGVAACRPDSHADADFGASVYDTPSGALASVVDDPRRFEVRGQEDDEFVFSAVTGPDLVVHVGKTEQGKWSISFMEGCIPTR